MQSKVEFYSLFLTFHVNPTLAPEHTGATVDIFSLLVYKYIIERS